MSTLKVNTIQDALGNNPSTAAQLNQGRAKAWVNFAGSGTLTSSDQTGVRDSFNISSVEDSAVGVYTPANTGGYIFAPSDIKYIDSPSTTSQITYDCRFRVENSSYTGKLNHTGANAAVSSLIAMEIGA